MPELRPAAIAEALPELHSDAPPSYPVPARYIERRPFEPREKIEWESMTDTLRWFRPVRWLDRAICWATVAPLERQRVETRAAAVALVVALVAVAFIAGLLVAVVVGLGVAAFAGLRVTLGAGFAAIWERVD
jgi:hypothetical protein